MPDSGRVRNIDTIIWLTLSLKEQIPHTRCAFSVKIDIQDWTIDVERTESVSRSSHQPPAFARFQLGIGMSFAERYVDCTRLSMLSGSLSTVLYR